MPSLNTFVDFTVGGTQSGGRYEGSDNYGDSGNYYGGSGAGRRDYDKDFQGQGQGQGSC